jgi:hypothetical protein
MRGTDLKSPAKRNIQEEKIRKNLSVGPLINLNFWNAHDLESTSADKSLKFLNFLLDL